MCSAAGCLHLVLARLVQSDSMHRWILGQGVKISKRDAVGVARNFFFASASKTQTPKCPLLYCRPMLLHVGIPNAHQMPLYPREQHRWIPNSSFSSSSSRKQKDPYIVLGVSRTATGPLLNFTFHLLPSLFLSIIFSSYPSYP